MERLTFNIGALAPAARSSVAGRDARVRTAPTPRRAPGRTRAVVRERYDWDYLWMLAFTALLFFRPQDQIPGSRCCTSPS